MTMSGCRRFVVVIGAVVAVAIASLGFAQQDILNDPSRPDAERARDAGSKPLEVYAFFGVEAGMTVVDLMPSAGYNTYILAPLVGSSGKVYSGTNRGEALAERLATNPLPNVQLIAGYEEIPANSVDVMITIRNMHHVVGGARETSTLAAFLAALKPGGIFGVVDARTTMDGYDSDTHRINQQMVIDAVVAAGFEFVESSEILANPDDDISQSSGERYEIDRLTLKFRKPGM